MNTYRINTLQSATQYSSIELDRIFAAFMTRVYMWMSFALILTAITAYIISQSESAIYFIFANKPVFYGLIIGELVLVVIISSAINKLSVQISSLLFVLYSILTGITISSIFVIFTEGSIASTFLIAALTFGAMSIFGATTKKDLTKWGNILIMALAGLIIASIVNLFFSNSTLYWITTYAGVLIFVGLIAYDTQKLKRLGNQIHGNNEIAKLSILGALTLYLDFINLFLYLLRIFGRKK